MDNRFKYSKNDEVNMVEVELTQGEADELREMEKIRADDSNHIFPGPGSQISIPLYSRDRAHEFSLDISRGRIDLAKIKYQNRVYQRIPLLRLDLGYKPHRNPDDTIISEPHIHIYQEGYMDKWAYPLSTDTYVKIFTNLDDKWTTLRNFLDFCNIVEPPNIQEGLF